MRLALPALPLAGRAVVLMDGVARTGRTRVQAHRAPLAELIRGAVRAF